jgi:UDPglucose 6-dehydrogenase
LPGAEALLILTDWKEFESLDLARVRENLAAPLVIDGRNLFSRKQMMQAGFKLLQYWPGSGQIRSDDGLES